MPTTSGAHVIFRNKNSFALAIHKALLFVGSHAFSESPLLPVRTTLSLHLSHGEGGLPDRNWLSGCAQYTQQLGRVAGFTYTGRVDSTFVVRRAVEISNKEND